MVSFVILFFEEHLLVIWYWINPILIQNHHSILQIILIISSFRECHVLLCDMRIKTACRQWGDLYCLLFFSCSSPQSPPPGASLCCITDTGSLGGHLKCQLWMESMSPSEYISWFCQFIIFPSVISPTSHYWGRMLLPAFMILLHNNSNWFNVYINDKVHNSMVSICVNCPINSTFIELEDVGFVHVRPCFFVLRDRKVCIEFHLFRVKWRYGVGIRCGMCPLLKFLGNEYPHTFPFTGDPTQSTRGQSCGWREALVVHWRNALLPGIPILEVCCKLHVIWKVFHPLIWSVTSWPQVSVWAVRQPFASSPRIAPMSSWMVMFGHVSVVIMGIRVLWIGPFCVRHFCRFFKDFRVSLRCITTWKGSDLNYLFIRLHGLLMVHHGSVWSCKCIVRLPLHSENRILKPQRSPVEKRTHDTSVKTKS